MSKTMALKANVPAVRSAKVPAVKAKREYRDFDDLMRLAETLVARFDDVVVRKHPADADTVRTIENFWRDVEHFDRDALYERTRMRPNLRKVHTEWQITRRVVGELIGQLLGGLSPGSISNLEIYTAMLIEEVYAANPSAITLEMTCRELRRTKPFFPSISVVLELLREHEENWSYRKGWILDLEEMVRVKRLEAPSRGDDELPIPRKGPRHG